ncbi:MAG: hypothetical protein QXF52_09025 [Thermoproteota archaeon]
MEKTIRMFNRNLIPMIFFSMLIVVSMVLMLLEASEFRIIPGDLGIADFQVILTPDYLIIKNPYRTNIIASYNLSTSSSTVSPKQVFTETFPLRLPKMIETYNKTICLRAWDFQIYNVLRVNYTEIKGRHVLQKVCAIDLKLRFEEFPHTDSSFKTVLEIIETPHEPRINETMSGFLEPLTGHLYGGFYLSSNEDIKIILRWEPAEMPILAAIYHEEGKIENFLLTGGECSGSLKAMDTGLNYLIIGNLDRNEDILYSGMIIYP